MFLGKVFVMDFLQKYFNFNGVFELRSSLPRNAQKRQKKSQEKKVKKKSRTAGATRGG
jgi:hypothetical protein